MSVQAFVDYLTLEKKYSVHTSKAYERDVREFGSFCKEEFDLIDLEQADYPLIRSWIVALIDKQVSNRSVNRKIASLKAYYKFLLRTGNITQNPLARHQSLKTPKRVEVPFSETEMERILQGRGAKDELDLAARHPRLEFIDLLLGHDVALLDGRTIDQRGLVQGARDGIGNAAKRACAFTDTAAGPEHACHRDRKSQNEKFAHA